MPTDSELIAQTAQAAAAARGAAEAVHATLGAVSSELARVRDAVVLVVLDGDHPRGATYVVQGLGAAKTWIRDGDQMADLLNRFPWVARETWSGETLSKIPTIGPDPDPPSQPAD